MMEFKIDQIHLMKKWTEQDAAMSAYEGWCVGITSKGNLVIQRVDEAVMFEDDDAAVDFVFKQFMLGSGLAAKAILAIITAKHEGE